GNPGSETSVYPSIRELPLLGVKYADLYRQTKIDETVYELLTERYELAKIEEAKEIPSVQVLDEPLVPDRKSFPPRFLFILLGTLGSVLMAGAWIIVCQRWRQMDPEDHRKLFLE